MVMEGEITNDHASDGLIPSAMPSVKVLLTVFVPHTDGINPSIKLFNGVVMFVVVRTTSKFVEFAGFVLWMTWWISMQFPHMMVIVKVCTMLTIKRIVLV
jgi:hypothetical protein